MKPDSEPAVVDTEAQRAALEEMSRALLEGLNAMVAEQERRAAEFARREHSLSALPEPLALPQAPAVPGPQVEPVKPAPAVPEEEELMEAPRSGRHVPPPPGAKQAATPPPAQQWGPAPRRSQPAAWRKAAEEEKERASIGSGVVGFVVLAIFFIIRSCSN